MSQVSLESLPPTTVWVVEDSPLEAEVARRALSGSFEVVLFSEGEAMLEQLAAGRSPDVLILDWQLPGISGGEICEFVRSRWSALALPVLFVTSPQSRRGTLEEGLTAGANDYVSKPYRGSELLARVKTLARVKHLHTTALEFEKQLLGIVSHDLRTPLQVILLTAQRRMLQEGSDSSTGAAFAKVEAAALQANRMIHDLLDFTQARLGGRIPVQKRPADFHEVSRRAFEDVALTAPGRPTAVSRSGDGTGLIDSDRFSQVVTNLTANAFRYGTPGTEVRLLTEGRRDELLLTVENAGPPIPPELLSRLFRPLQQGQGVGEAAPGKGRSIGLGLYIVQKVVEAHGGSVSVASSERGTSFAVRIPRGRALAREESTG